MLLLLYYPRPGMVQLEMRQLVRSTVMLLLLLDLLEALESVVLVRLALALYTFPLLQLTFSLEPV